MQEKLSVSLKTLSQLNVGGTAAKVFYPESIDEFIQILKEYPNVKIVGGGSNLFFTDSDVSSVVVTKNLDSIEQDQNDFYWAQCGVSLSKLFSFAVGVPATVGGGVLMNFGAFGKELSEFIEAVEVFDKDKNRIVLKKDELDFSYRNSSLRNNQQVVLRVLFNNKYLEHKSEWLEKRKNNMPYEFPNIGSVFKNPPNNSAGKLIEEAGLKGYLIGDAQVSEKHANIIVNKGSAAAKDIKGLIKHIKNVVKEKYNIELETEVECLGE